MQILHYMVLSHFCFITCVVCQAAAVLPAVEEVLRHRNISLQVAHLSITSAQSIKC